MKLTEELSNMMRSKYNFKELIEFFVGIVGSLFLIIMMIFLVYYCFIDNGRWLLFIFSFVCCLPLFFIRNQLSVKFKIFKSFSIFLVFYTIVTILVDSSALLQREKFKLLHPNWIQVKQFEIIDSKVLVEKQRRLPDISYINLHVKYLWQNNYHIHFFEKNNIREQPWFFYNLYSETQLMQDKLEHILDSKDYELYIDPYFPQKNQLFSGLSTFEWRQSFIAILILHVFQSLLLIALPFIFYFFYLKMRYENKT